MIGKTLSQHANQPDALPSEGPSFLTWTMVGVLAWVFGVFAVSPTIWMNPTIDMEALGNLVLVDQMEWSTSKYSTQGTIAKELPFYAYRSKVFPQPPGYAMFLKIFADRAGPPSEENQALRTTACQRAAYLLHAAALLVYIGATVRWCRVQGFDVIPCGIALGTIAVCPILVANTLWLRAEGIAAYLAIASLLLLTSDKGSHWSSGIAAGVIGGFALLVHASALWIVPFGAAMFGLAYAQPRPTKADPISFRPLIVFLAMALAMSNWHYFRLVSAVGPDAFRLYQSPIDQMPANDDTMIVGLFRNEFRRPAAELIPEWLATTPVLVALLAMLPRVRTMIAGDESENRIGDRWIVVTLLMIFVDFSLRWLWGGCYQLRFCSLWAAMLAPAMVACYYRCSPNWRSWASGLAIATLFFQIAGCVPAATFLAEPSYVTPVPAYMVRPWMTRYPPVSKINLQQERAEP